MGFGDTTHSGCDTRIRQLTDQRQDLYEVLKNLVRDPSPENRTRAEEVVAKFGPIINAARRLY